MQNVKQSQNAGVSPDGVRASGMVAMDALKEAIEALGKHPEALDHYGVEQARTFAAHRKPAAVLNALLSVLKAQRTAVKALKHALNPQHEHAMCEKTESLAVDAAITILKLIKEDPGALKRFMKEQQDFYNSYEELLEQPLEDIQALRSYVSAEIKALNDKKAEESASVKAHRAVIEAINLSLSSLEHYPEVLAELLRDEETSRDTDAKH